MKLVHITGKKGSGKNVLLGVARDRGYVVEEIDWGYQKLLSDRNARALDMPPQEEWRDHVVKVVFEDHWKVKYSGNSVVFFTGLYKPAEISYLKGLKEIELRIVSVTVVSDEVRHKRIIRRARPKEANLTIPELTIKDLNREGVSKGYENNNILAVMSMADYTIANDGTVEEFRSAAHRLIDRIESEFIRRV